MTDEQLEYLTTAQVAERVGIKKQTVTQTLYRRLMPQPDLILFGIPLWMPETIDAWRAQCKKGRKKVRSRRTRKSRTVPPKNAKLSTVGAVSDFRPAGGVTDEETAKRIAAELRGEGHHCTAADVLELAVADPDRLSYERRRLQHRVQRKVRGALKRT